MVNGVISTRRSKKGPSQFSVCGDIFDLLDNVHKSPYNRRDSPVAQNPAETEV